MTSPKPFETKAFDLTPDEKHETLGDVKSLLLIAGSRIQKAKTLGASRTDWHETLDLVNRALIMAEDPDACDPSLTPLVSCYLYAGHCLLALGEESRAYVAYEKAATGEPHALVDFPSVQLAARHMLEMRGKPIITKASTETPSQKSESQNPPSNPSPDDNIGSLIERPDSLFLPSGIEEIPLLVSVRPGPQRKRPSKNPGENPGTSKKAQR
ncbi:hypothetical protein EV127DRAFT_413958 [Xylaria flabelliformis]|nr:hypothetical protein EV127DRAFT_413958 [Xylaria flabelliformis]